MLPSDGTLYCLPMTVFTSLMVVLARMEKNKRKRRELLEQFFWEQMANEVLQDFSEPHPIEKYSSEYDGSFNIPDYKPALDAFETDSDLHRKYPLYTDGGLSYWQQKCGRTGRGPFKRNSFFSKPMSEVLDEPPEGL
ncbi:uncharacterized protein [Anabrus simplex]|uniref:uncharacterized protein isoform X2 n=1 Tax=Anabrus simplex TaxID=316456 RepID=UPI0034DD4C71